MKITQAQPKALFVPVTLTFETLKELNKFVSDIGHKPDDFAVKFEVWEELSIIACGYSKS